MNNPEFTTPSGNTASRQVWQQTVDAVLVQTKNQATGLNSVNAAECLNTSGPNALSEKKGKPGWLRSLVHFNDVLICVLLAVMTLTAIMGYWVDTLVILGVTVINTLIGHIQESNAGRSLQGIRNMPSSDARVQRNGKHEAIPTCDLVPGDIVILRVGDHVSADTRLIETHNLWVEEAILTGESTAVDKITDVLEGNLPPGDRVNMIFSGTTVSAGDGIGVMTAIGVETEFGYVNQMMAGIERHRTPLLTQMDKLGKAIFVITFVTMVALFTFSPVLRDIPIGELLLLLISLAVAVVPEGLSAIIPIILSLSVQTMTHKRMIIRKPSTVETLGVMTAVCSDKTGTLTMNEMTVKATITADCCYRVEGDSYEPQGRILLEGSDESVQVQSGTALETWLRAIDLCNDSQLAQDERGLWGITGGPTEGVLKMLAAKAQPPAVEARLVVKILFDPQHKYIPTLQHIDGEARVLITSAPDVIFAMCHKQMSHHGAVPFEAHYWGEEVARFARQGLRMMAAACKPASLDATTLDHEDLQEGLIFLGIAGMMDPSRPEAIDATHACQAAGTRMKMIAGNHLQTAMSIGQMLRITNSSQAMTGYQLEHIDDAALTKVAVEYDIFARTSPEHKPRLVKALQDNGEVVNMIGDGVNDVPVPRQVNVGIAMGIKGIEVTKEAADMVLTDDNFATIANSVKEGRRVYDNLRKTILFIMPTNLAQGLLTITALLAGNIIPLTLVLILWMNMATSATLSLGLAFEAAEHNMTNHLPRRTGQHVTDGFAVWRAAFVGFMVAIAVSILEARLAPRGHSPEFIRTVLLQMLVMAQWAYMTNCCNNDSFSLSMGLLRNRGIWLVTGVLLLMQLATIYVPLMQSVFDTEALPLRYWFITLVIGAAMLLVMEVEKRLTRRFRKTA